MESSAESGQFPESASCYRLADRDRSVATVRAESPNSKELRYEFGPTTYVSLETFLIESHGSDEYPAPDAVAEHAWIASALEQDESPSDMRRFLAAAIESRPSIVSSPWVDTPVDVNGGETNFRMIRGERGWVAVGRVEDAVIVGAHGNTMFGGLRLTSCS